MEEAEACLFWAKKAVDIYTHISTHNDKYNTLPPIQGCSLATVLLNIVDNKLN